MAALIFCLEYWLSSQVGGCCRHWPGKSVIRIIIKKPSVRRPCQGGLDFPTMKRRWWDQTVANIWLLWCCHEGQFLHRTTSVYMQTKLPKSTVSSHTVHFIQIPCQIASYIPLLTWRNFKHIFEPVPKEDSNLWGLHWGPQPFRHGCHLAGRRPGSAAPPLPLDDRSTHFNVAPY